MRDFAGFFYLSIYPPSTSLLISSGLILLPSPRWPRSLASRLPPSLGTWPKTSSSRPPPEDSISCLSWSPVANHLAVSSWDNKVRIYDVTGSPAGSKAPGLRLEPGMGNGMESSKWSPASVARARARDLTSRGHIHLPLDPTSTSR